MFTNKECLHCLNKFTARLLNCFCQVIPWFITYFTSPPGFISIYVGCVRVNESIMMNKTAVHFKLTFWIKWQNLALFSTANIKTNSWLMMYKHICEFIVWSLSLKSFYGIMIFYSYQNICCRWNPCLKKM